MFDHFLTDLLKVIILVDLLGVVAYFILGAIKPRTGRSSPDASPFEATAPQGALLESLSSSQPSGIHRMRDRLTDRFPRLSCLKKHMHRRAPVSSQNLETALSRLRRVLHSYQEGLA